MTTIDDKEPQQQTRDLSAMIERANAMLLDINRIDALAATNKRDTQNIIQNLSRDILRIKAHVADQKNQKKMSILAIKSTLYNLNLSLRDMGLTASQQTTLSAFLTSSLSQSIVQSESEIEADIQLESILEDISVLIELHR